MTGWGVEYRCVCVKRCVTVTGVGVQSTGMTCHSVRGWGLGVQFSTG